MRYFGSKVSTINDLSSIIGSKIAFGSFCDCFGGIGTVGSHFKANGYDVWTGDLLTFAHYFQISRIQCNGLPEFAQLREALGLEHSVGVADLLNSLRPVRSWFVREYAQERQFFTIRNAARIEACRLSIARWSRNGWLTHDERAVLLASLINSIDKVANTAGTYYAYLKDWHRKALLPFRFEFIIPTHGNIAGHCFFGQAKDLVALRAFDVLYLDPPYNGRSYARYYHLPETVAAGKTPKTYGMSGMPVGERVSSDFNKSREARRALEELLELARFRLLAFHYSDDGLIAPDELKNVLRAHGRIEEHVLDSRGYTTEKISRTVKHRLYLVHHG